MRRKSAGFTLIEMMVAVLITLILARIGFDMYKRYIMRANRSIARTVLLNLAAKEEQTTLSGSINTAATGYATNFYALIGVGTSSSLPTSYYIDQGGAISTSQTGSSIYQISFSSVSASAYVLQATAQGVQATRDTTCTTLLLSNTGLKKAQNSSGTAQTGSTLTDCWEK